MTIPAKYNYLFSDSVPPMIKEAIKLYGTNEVAGSGNNPKIIAWAKELGLKDYTADSIPWCGLGIAYVAKKAGYTPVKDPLWAQNWKNFGVAAVKPQLGDVLVFKRDGGGHVGLYVGDDSTAYHVLGFNQSDSVTITRILKSRCIGIRRPPNVVSKGVKLDASGEVSKNEA